VPHQLPLHLDDLAEHHGSAQATAIRRRPAPILVAGLTGQE
jgi:hypothetical protein